MKVEAKNPLRTHIKGKLRIYPYYIIFACMVAGVVFLLLPPLAANYYLNFALSVIALIAAMLVSLSLYAPASDKFLASIAESNSIPVSLKAEVAKFLKENGSISMRELYLIDEKYVAEQEKSKEGYLKMLSFIEFDDAQKQQDSKEGVES